MNNETKKFVDFVLKDNENEVSLHSDYSRHNHAVLCCLEHILQIPVEFVSSCVGRLKRRRHNLGLELVEG